MIQELLPFQEKYRCARINIFRTKIPVTVPLLVRMYVLYLEHGKKSEVFINSQPVKEHVVLGTDPQALSDLVHVGSDVIVIDHCCATSGCVQTCIQSIVIICATSTL